MGSIVQQSPDDIAKALLKQHNPALGLISCKVLQQLWAGYGHICQVRAELNCQSVIFIIMKQISPPVTHTDGHLSDEGHIRKIVSYQVEQYFYTHLAPQMPKNIGVAECLASSSPGKGSGTAMLLTDLRVEYPVAGEKRAELSEKQMYAALEWLARFHGFWWRRVGKMGREKLCLPPLEHFEKYGSTALENEGVWLNGGYT